jgi:protein required for attachment to host cells
VADGRRARFFGVGFSEGAAEGGPSVSEFLDLANPQAQVRGDNLLERSRNVAPGGGSLHRYDDHTERHVEEKGARFARAIVEAFEAHVARNHPGRLVLVAEPQTLGRLRRAFGTHIGEGWELVELAKDLSALTEPQIKEALIRYRLLPTPPRPVGIYQPKGQTTVPAVPGGRSRRM